MGPAGPARAAAAVPRPFPRDQLRRRTRRDLAGFLVGFLSPSLPDAAYIHFVGVDPRERGSGLARVLYERFFALAVADGRRVVRAVTAPVNTASIAFHTAMGFTVTAPIPDYDGPRPPRSS